MSFIFSSILRSQCFYFVLFKNSPLTYELLHSFCHIFSIAIFIIPTRKFPYSPISIETVWFRTSIVLVCCLIGYCLQALFSPPSVMLYLLTQEAFKSINEIDLNIIETLTSLPYPFFHQFFQDRISNTSFFPMQIFLIFLIIFQEKFQIPGQVFG